MRTAIIYFSKTGHSKKIAKAVSEALHIQAEDIRTNPKLSDIDLLFVAGGIYAGKSNPAMIRYVSGIDRSMAKRAALLTSCAGKETRQDMVREALQKNGIEVAAEEFMCRGSFLFMGRGHPDQAEVDAAIAYARRMIG